MKATILLLCLALSAAVVVEAGIAVDHDKSVDFSQYRSYFLEEMTPAPNPFTQQRIVAAVDAELRSDGLVAAESEGEADLLVMLYASADQEQRITGDSWSYGGSPGWSGWSSWGSSTTVMVTTIAVGTLIVDLVDVAGQKLVWRGVATDSIPQKQAKLERKIERTVEKLFRHFPPE